MIKNFIFVAADLSMRTGNICTMQNLPAIWYANVM